ncbi:hypothetical protein TNCV_1719511 [Trichonephila clavipes]|nr:hypothetical protein TNCV_1719511 [Trichonephila clavipes]
MKTKVADVETALHKKSIEKTIRLHGHHYGIHILVEIDERYAWPWSRKSSREEGEERWEAPDHPKSFLPQNWGGTEQLSSVPCMVLKAKANDRRKNLAPSREEFRGP